jgi:hypothetical protein
MANNRALQVRGLLLCQNDNLGQTCTNFVRVAARIQVEQLIPAQQNPPGGCIGSGGDPLSVQV